MQSFYTLLSFKELLRLSRLERTLNLPCCFGLVGEVGQAVRTGLEAGKEHIMPSHELLISVENCWQLTLTARLARGGSLEKHGLSFTTVSGESRDRTSRTLRGDWLLSLYWNDLVVMAVKSRKLCLFRADQNAQEANSPQDAGSPAVLRELCEPLCHHISRNSCSS